MVLIQVGVAAAVACAMIDRVVAATAETHASGHGYWSKGIVGSRKLDVNLSVIGMHNVVLSLELRLVAVLWWEREW